MAYKPPPPAAKTGRVICPGCNKSLSDGRETTEIVGSVDATPRGSAARSVSAPATITWHAECLSEFEARNQRLRDQSKYNTLEMLRSLNEAGNLGHTEEQMRKMAGLE